MKAILIILISFSLLIGEENKDLLSNTNSITDMNIQSVSISDVLEDGIVNKSITEKNVRSMKIFKNLHIIFSSISYTGIMASEIIGVPVTIRLYNGIEAPNLLQILHHSIGVIGMSLYTPAAIFSWVYLILKKRFGMYIKPVHTWSCIATTIGALYTTITMIITGALSGFTPGPDIANFKYFALGHAISATAFFAVPYTIALFSGVF